MYRTKEIRWFFQTENQAMNTWFEDNGYVFEETNARTDYYLSVIEKEDVGIKLRESNIEVKHRTHRCEEQKLTKGVHGYYEYYTKWSFSSAGDDSLVQEITEEDKYDWLPVKKERLGFKLKENINGEIRRVRMDEYPEFGCQLEYSRLNIKDRIWFTFALEWFGEKEIQFDLSLLNKILGDHNLSASESMGYAEFLKKHDSF